MPAATASTTESLDLPRFRGEVRAWIRLSGFTSCCPPVSWHSLVRPPAEPFFRPDPRTDAAAARSGGQGRPLPAAPEGLFIDGREHGGTLMCVAIDGCCMMPGVRTRLVRGIRSMSDGV